jgi:hypothetical protein
MVEEPLARRKLPKTYQEQRQYALNLVAMHLEGENRDRIDECIKSMTKMLYGGHRARAVRKRRLTLDVASRVARMGRAEPHTWRASREAS